MLMDIGKLSEPATRLVDKISDAFEGYFKPFQIKRVAEAEGEAKKIEAKAESEAQKIKAEADEECNEIQERAIKRFISEEVKKQENIEEIASKALENVREDANPESIEDDWMTNFLDKSRLVSDDEMQDLWARILSGEANNPGRYSKKTVDILSSMESEDADLFSSVCRFSLKMDYEIIPFIYNPGKEIYAEPGVNLFGLERLNDFGLIKFISLGNIGHFTSRPPTKLTLKYFEDDLILFFTSYKEDVFETGSIRFSKFGAELAPICEVKPKNGFIEYLKQTWTNKGIEVFINNKS